MIRASAVHRRPKVVVLVAGEVRAGIRVLAFIASDLAAIIVVFAADCFGHRGDGEENDGKEYFLHCDSGLDWAESIWSPYGRFPFFYQRTVHNTIARKYGGSCLSLIRGNPFMMFA